MRPLSWCELICKGGPQWLAVGQRYLQETSPPEKGNEHGRATGRTVYRPLWCPQPPRADLLLASPGSQIFLQSSPKLHPQPGGATETQATPPPPANICGASTRCLVRRWGRGETRDHHSFGPRGLQSGGVVSIGEEGRTAARKDKSRVLSAVPE